MEQLPAGEAASRTTGVADYFAVLGVGDVLRWKHQKHQQRQKQQQQKHDEQHAAQRERFQREIVQIRIVSVPVLQRNTTNMEDSMIQEAARSDEANVTKETNKNSSVQHAMPPKPSGQDGLVLASTNSSSLLASPSLQSEASNNSSSVLLNKNSNTVITSADHAQIIIDGWTIVTQTTTNNHTSTDANLLANNESHQSNTTETTRKTHKWRQDYTQKLASVVLSRQRAHAPSLVVPSYKFYLAYQRRQQHLSATDPSQQEPPIRAIADLRLFYVRIHAQLVWTPAADEHETDVSCAKNNDTKPPSPTKRLANLLLSSSSKTTAFANNSTTTSSPRSNTPVQLVPLHLFLPTDEYEEWSIPNDFQWIRDPQSISPTTTATTTMTGLYTNDSGQIEAIDETTRAATTTSTNHSLTTPKLVAAPDDTTPFFYIPVVALRRQRIGEEERFREDSALVDLAVTTNHDEASSRLYEESDEDEDAEEEDDHGFRILAKTPWKSTGTTTANNNGRRPTILARRNVPSGFADVAFATTVLGRFPYKNYKDLPLPVEELPMFCYPIGCRLHRARYSDAPVPQYYGFVVKNERGDSIYVSCVSFMEPLTPAKVAQLSSFSEQRQTTSLAHWQYCHHKTTRSDRSTASTEVDSLVTSFDEMTTFENKTICLVSRYPFWTAFRKYLLHLHLLSSSTSCTVPLERYISHLLLAVPVPRPGGPNVLIPLPALSIVPMVLSMPPEKDFPLVDLPFQRLFACLEIGTVVTIVLSLLALERKLIIMSARPSLVLDVCELLRSLLFPFELCAPYVPRLTEPFKSSLEFPGAIFVGIHDDGSPDGLAAMVKKTYPEDSIVVDLDTGAMDCDGDRVTIISQAWDLIPRTARFNLVAELEALCKDAGIVDGQEPLDSQYDSSFDVVLDAAVDDVGLSSKVNDAFDDRAVRDAFLRFFCAVLGGYERFLVMPGADFLVSGDDWFDAKGFLASVPPENAPYLNSLVSTQLFQSFIQRRTEASDVHCLLFDESLAEFHSTTVPYGRLGGDVEVFSNDTVDEDHPKVMYSLLVDQSAAGALNASLSVVNLSKSMDTADEDTLANLSKLSVCDITPALPYAESAVNHDGDLVTAPSKVDLPTGGRYTYSVEGNPCFPHSFNPRLFLPREPESWMVELSKSANPILARSEREIEAANRRRRLATSYRGFQTERRCLWQLPKLMGSHFLGTWLLCVPAQVAQDHLSHEQQSSYLLRALGALRLLRSKQRIVPDEASYRALMVACGRAESDRRVELVKLFGLLRSDGIFPSAVTLGQYTKALAEGYSKRAVTPEKEEDTGSVEVTDSGGRYNVISQRSSTERDLLLNQLDASLSVLEESGRRWRTRSAGRMNGLNNSKRSTSRPWLPTVYSSSFAVADAALFTGKEEMRFLAIWSRTRACEGCGYVPLEEEVQAGWDIVGGENEIPGAVCCPRCGNLIAPMLGYRDLSLQDALQHEMACPVTEATDTTASDATDFSSFPPQITPHVLSNDDDTASYVAYISPIALRQTLESYVDEHGEDILEREKLREFDSEVWVNLWWYSARFSLPLPLPVSPQDGAVCHYAAFAAWERIVAERGCWSGAKVLRPFFSNASEDPNAVPSFDSSSVESFDDLHLLSRFNLQGYYSTVWDNTDLSSMLVSLVEACDKRDFKPVVQTVLEVNRRRREQAGFVEDANSSVGGSDRGGVEVTTHLSAVELDLYRTLLYLAKYQCATAFHSFFPATVKACKGYHYWCAIGTPMPMFDRLLRDSLQRSHHDHLNVPSEVALGFRCVFGHLI